MVVSSFLLKMSIKMLCLSSFLEQVWESKLVFISLSVFELWITIVGLGIIYNAHFEV